MVGQTIPQFGKNTWRTSAKTHRCVAVDLPHFGEASDEVAPAWGYDFDELREIWGAWFAYMVERMYSRGIVQAF